MRAILKKGRVGIHVFLPLQNTYCSVAFAIPNIIHIFSRRFLHFNIFEVHSSNIFHFIDKLVSLISCIWQSLYLHVDREVPLGAIIMILTHEVLVLPSYWNQSISIWGQHYCICCADQLTGFYMRATMALNELNLPTKVIFKIKSC